MFIYIVEKALWPIRYAEFLYLGRHLRKKKQSIATKLSNIESSLENISVPSSTSSQNKFDVRIAIEINLQRLGKLDDDLQKLNRSIESVVSIAPEFSGFRTRTTKCQTSLIEKRRNLQQLSNSLNRSSTKTKIGSSSSKDKDKKSSDQSFPKRKLIRGISMPSLFNRKKTTVVSSNEQTTNKSKLASRLGRALSFRF